VKRVIHRLSTDILYLVKIFFAFGGNRVAKICLASVNKGVIMISPETIHHIAKLSRLSFSENEIKQYSEQLSAILDYVDQLSELDTTDVSPTSHALYMANVFREDGVKQSLSSEQIFMNAPDSEETYFKVPQIMGDK
jgi:aspartyl-tRNA(Asn)/glutamyl-tRNA(Gln) amidotransferase subunit C